MSAVGGAPTGVRLWTLDDLEELEDWTFDTERYSLEPFDDLEALERRFGAEPSSPDCLLVPGDEDRVEVAIGRLHAKRPYLPVLLVSEGPEGQIGVEVVDPDANRVANFGPVQPENGLTDLIDLLVSWSRQLETSDDRATRYEALSADPNLYVWVLDADGITIDQNRAAEALGLAPAAEPFWTADWWQPAEGDGPHLRPTIDAALEGEIDGTSGRITGDEGTPTHVELTCYPVQAHRDSSTVLIVGRDVTERVELEHELRESERLHRITLNNMTDTVLVTDDAGRFTYICPNVHFIFGYSAEEVREMGTIDQLLGQDLFDQSALAAAGVLSNLDCPVTDKYGEDHHLLVNVREVDIQGGTTLYSCRDITTRKRREDSLTALHRTARNLLYEETTEGIGQRVVDDAAEILEYPLSVVYEFDTDRSILTPVATSDTLDHLAGSLPEIEATGRSDLGRAFVEGESIFVEDGLADEEGPLAATLGSAAYVPLGDHGVFVVGTERRDAFSAVSRELTELLAATTEAALDREEREQTLREQERELQRQNRRLSRLNQINEIIRSIDRAVLEAETRAEIEAAVCERLTAARFEFAWIGEPDSTTGELRPSAWAGTHEGYLDSIDLRYGDDNPEPSCQAVDSRTATVVQNVAEGFRREPWRTEALQRGFQSVMSVPLAYDEFLYGVLTVYLDERAESAEGTVEVLEELGKTVASAISAVERKNALLSTASTEAEYEIADTSFPLIRLSDALDAPLATEGPLQRSADGVFLFIRIESPDTDAIKEASESLTAISDFQHIRSEADHAVVRLEVPRPFIALSLVDHGVTIQDIRAEAGTARFVIRIPDGISLQTVDQVFRNAFTDPQLVSKRQLDGDSGVEAGSFLDDLTDRQLEVVQAAFHAGYFESPRGSTGEEVAGALGISAPGFYNHIRAVERKLFTRLIEDSTIDVES